MASRRRIQLYLHTCLYFALLISLHAESNQIVLVSISFPHMLSTVATITETPLKPSRQTEGL